MIEDEVLTSRILIIDDHPANLRLLEDLFIGEGMTQVVGATDARTALGLYNAFDLTADATAEAKRRALALGAKDFLTKPFDTLEAMLRVWNLLETRLLYKRLLALTPKDPLAPQSFRGRRD